MSGPKTSYYTLTPEQLKILQEQLERELLRQENLGKLQRISSTLKTIESQFKEDAEKASELLERTQNDSGFSSKIIELRNEIKVITSDISTVSSDASFEIVEAKLKKANASVKNIDKIVAEINNISKSNDIALKNDINEKIAKGFNSSFAQMLKQKKNIKKEEIQENIERLSHNAILPKSYIAELCSASEKLKVISDDNFLKNFNAVTVYPLIKKCEQHITEYDVCKSEYDELIIKYEALCKTLGINAEITECTNSGIRYLKEKISMLEAQLSKSAEQEYISDCIDEVMVEMGYDLLGHRDVTKRNGKHFHNELYTFSEGTAVNVTYSSEGKITMELGGLDSIDRLPTDIEKQHLCEEMYEFCGDFKEIEKRLAAKGVISRHISILPPEAEFAQIINTKDYEIKQETTELSVKKKQKQGLKSVKYKE